MIPEEEYENGHILTSRSLKKLNDAGVGINLGAHGQLQGLGAHWELWMLQQGGIGCAQGGITGTFTPMYLIVARKPFDAPPAKGSAKKGKASKK